MENSNSRQVEAGFDAVASGYDRPALQGFISSAKRLVEMAELMVGMRVLEVGTGTGNATIAAATAVGPLGRLVSVEISAEMRSIARQKVDRAGLSNVEIV